MSERSANYSTSAGEPDIAESLADAVLSVAGVAGLHAGLFGEIATHLPGRQVPGIRLRSDGAVEVHVTVRWEWSVPDTADEVRLVVQRLIRGDVHVTVEDVVAAPATTPRESGRTQL